LLCEGRLLLRRLVQARLQFCRSRLELVEAIREVLQSRDGCSGGNDSAGCFVLDGCLNSFFNCRSHCPASDRHRARLSVLHAAKDCHAAGAPTLPVDKGAPGRVILAFSGAKGEPYESIREKGYHIWMGEREAEVASVAAPVFGLNWRLLGSMCISGPSSRLTKAKLEQHAKNVIRAANQLSYALAGSRSAVTPAAISRWHP
jgi:hypothetical protein